MSIFQNAIDSIQVGVEDYQFNDERRTASSIRNVSAGVLLLYKEKLCRLSPKDDPELLISKNLVPESKPDGSLMFKGKGKRTVDVQAIKERFGSLNVTVDWKVFDKVNFLRNNVEHYYTSETPVVVREILAKSFVLIQNFLTTELEEEPREVLGEKCWNVLLDISGVYTEEQNVCSASISNIDWKFETVACAATELRCPKCSSELIKVSDYLGKYPDINLLCSSCGNSFKFSDVLTECVHNYLYADAYISMTDGGEFPYSNCNECDEPIFVIEENACMSCCYEPESFTCSYCSAELEDYEEDGKVCDRCLYVHDQMNKD